MMSEAAGARGAHTSVLVVFGVAVVLVPPAIAPVFTLAQRSVVEGEGEM